METVKMPYFPSAVVHSKKSPLGSLLLYGDKDLYNRKQQGKNPLDGKTIVRIDCLKELERIWGTGLTATRDLTHKLVHGDMGDKEYRTLITSVYRRYAEFAMYVDTCAQFGDRSANLITNLMTPVRELLDNRVAEIVEAVTRSGGKILLYGDEYVYASFTHCNIPELNGLEVTIKC